MLLTIQTMPLPAVVPFEVMTGPLDPYGQTSLDAPTRDRLGLPETTAFL